MIYQCANLIIITQGKILSRDEHCFKTNDYLIVSIAYYRLHFNILHPHPFLLLLLMNISSCLYSFMIYISYFYYYHFKNCQDAFLVILNFYSLVVWFFALDLCELIGYQMNCYSSFKNIMNGISLYCFLSPP